MVETAIDARTRRRNRLMLVAIGALFFGAMLVAGVLRFSGWRPEGSRNKGEMLQPYGDLREHAPTQADGTPYRWSDSPRTWRMLAMPRDCAGARAAACAELLRDLGVVRQLMGKETGRAHILWAGEAPAGAVLPAGTHLLRADATLAAGLPRSEDPAGDAVWLVDPNGFVVLRYAPGFEPGDLRADLARLLKIN